MVAQLEQDTAVTVAAGETVQCASAVVTAVPAYNMDKFRPPGQPYHPQEAGGLGYVVELDGFGYYHAGDTDPIPEMSGIHCDVALLPVGGTFTMTADEAVRACDTLNAGTSSPCTTATSSAPRRRRTLPRPLRHARHDPAAGARLTTRRRARPRPREEVSMKVVLVVIASPPAENDGMSVG